MKADPGKTTGQTINKASRQTAERSGGLVYAIVAYVIWGVMPVYMLLLMHVPPLELVGWRIICTVPVCLLIVLARKQMPQLRLAMGNPRVLGALLGSTILIAVNWTTFVLAAQSGHVLAASLGYYINPLVNVLFGTLFLRERLSRAQWLAVAIAGVGVGLLAWGALDTLWISLTLALSFAGYGLVRKTVAVESLPGLTIETLLLLPPAIGVAAWFAATPEGSALIRQPDTALLVMGFGTLTAIPLLLFAAAARRMDLSTLGFVQYLAPTLSFFAALYVFGEPLRTTQLVCFLLIWAAIAVFVFDMLARRRARLRAG